MITVNGTPLSDFGFIALSRSLPGVGGRRHALIDIPGGPSVRAGAAISPGRVSVPGHVTGATHAAILAAVDAMALHLQGESIIRLDDYPDREWVGYLEDQSRLQFLDPQWTQRAAALTLEWVLPDPTARARTETVRTGSGALVLGSAPSPLRIEFTGASATIRVRAGGSAGAILTELVWAGTSGAVVVDAETQTISRAGANAIGGMTAASRFPVADPADGADYVSVPAGATVRYRRRWW